MRKISRRSSTVGSKTTTPRRSCLMTNPSRSSTIKASRTGVVLTLNSRAMLVCRSGCPGANRPERMASRRQPAIAAVTVTLRPAGLGETIRGAYTSESGTADTRALGCGCRDAYARRRRRLRTPQPPVCRGRAGLPCQQRYGRMGRGARERVIREEARRGSAPASRLAPSCAVDARNCDRRERGLGNRDRSGHL